MQFTEIQVDLNSFIMANTLWGWSSSDSREAGLKSNEVQQYKWVQNSMSYLKGWNTSDGEYFQFGHLFIFLSRFDIHCICKNNITLFQCLQYSFNYKQCFQLSGYIRKSGHFKIPAEVILTILRKSGHFCTYRALGKKSGSVAFCRAGSSTWQTWQMSGGPGLNGGLEYSFFLLKTLLNT